MKIIIESSFLTANDIKDGDKITITNEGVYKQNKWGNQALQIGVKLPNGEEKTCSMNATSQRWMIKTYGDDSQNWIGKIVPVFAISQMVQGKMKKVIYFGEIPTDDSNVPVENVQTEEDTPPPYEN